MCDDNILGTLFEEPVTDRVTDRVPSIALNMWGDCSTRNVRRVVRENRCFKPLRIYLLKRVLTFLEMADVTSFVYGGTALSVYRENGKMIAHDKDIDLATMEYDENNEGTCTKLVKSCIAMQVEFSGVDGLNPLNTGNSFPDIRLDFASGVTYKRWLNIDGNGEVSEIKYDGSDCKRIKFFFSDSGLINACQMFGKGSNVLKNIRSDPSLVHVDLFTLSADPLSPESHIRVNWNIPGCYDSSQKRFPIFSFFPLASSVFEGLTVRVPADLETYLKVEYGYLGKDAMYDYKQQLYVPIPPLYRHILPPCLEGSYTTRQ